MEVIRAGGTAWLAYEDGRGILVDGGLRADGAGILKRIRALNVQVPLIFLTHTHYDHTGGVEALRSALGAKVMVGESEAAYLRQGHTPVPRGVNAFTRFLSRAAHSVQSKTREHYAPVTQDIAEAGESGALEAYGFDAQYVHLGAHSAGSTGLYIGEYFFTGDTVFGIGGTIYPPFADLPDEISAAWCRIVDSGAKYICPGHGRMVKMETLKKEYNRRFGAM